jgi:hypothetical protein
MQGREKIWGEHPPFRLGKSTIAAPSSAAGALRFTESVLNDSRRCGANAYVVHRCAQRQLGQSINFSKMITGRLFVSWQLRHAVGEVICPAICSNCTPSSLFCDAALTG